jgi:hypothetical protein
MQAEIYNSLYAEIILNLCKRLGQHCTLNFNYSSMFRTDEASLQRYEHFFGVRVCGISTEIINKQEDSFRQKQLFPSKLNRTNMVKR